MDIASDSPLRSVPPSPPSHPPLHVLQIVGNGIVGGMERCVERLVAGLGRTGAFRFTVLCPSEGDFAERIRAAGGGIGVVAMPEDPPWASIQMVASLIAAERVDLVHAHLPNAHVLGGLAARLAGVPCMTTIHGRQVILPDLEVHRLVGSHLSVVCRQSYYHALGLGVDPDRLSLEPNGVDVEMFRPGPRPAGGLRAALGLGAEALLAGFVGRLSPEKAPEVFIRGAAQLLQRLPDAHFALVGEGPMKTQLRENVERMGLAGRIHLTGGIDDVRPVFHDLDLLVSSSNSEAMPLALMEGMASGLPVVATRVGGVPEIVEHGGTGWLVAARDYEDLAGRMHQMLTLHELRRRMGEAARARMEKHHRLDRALEGLANRMRSLARPATAAASTLAVARVPRVAAGSTGSGGGRKAR
ncbi:glycosyltransferase [Mitsuaria sp. GD03876]|uniref:glycosyltransferase n=1 Tax=Mitsuaria sp. GD03876 TaxID=2975399 RepID=UPI00244B3417|nr:glycosyltransferase [Mitsuaria sp. GD03876]MDH0868157.1 glycosyltransferase [Mitsuaria sp. GD03876]